MADSKGNFIRANIVTSDTSLLQGQAYTAATSRMIWLCACTVLAIPQSRCSETTVFRWIFFYQSGCYSQEKYVSLP